MISICLWDPQAMLPSDSSTSARCYSFFFLSMLFGQLCPICKEIEHWYLFFSFLYCFYYKTKYIKALFCYFCYLILYCSNLFYLIVEHIKLFPIVVQIFFSTGSILLKLWLKIFLKVADDAHIAFFFNIYIVSAFLQDGTCILSLLSCIS